ncbi:hypothetical protein ACWGLC_12675 [Dietzia sp. NPDC055877]
MIELSVAVIAGLSSLLIAFLTLYRGVPEKRVIDLQSILDRPSISEKERVIVSEAVSRQIARLEAPNLPRWFLYWAAVGTVLFIFAAVLVGMFADDLGKVIFYAIYGAYVVTSTVMAIEIARRVFLKRDD